jgi:hypothetical protein
MSITKFGDYPIDLGIPLLRLHDVAIRFASNIVIFGSQYCTTNCHDTPVTVNGVTEEPPTAVYQVKNIFEPHIRPTRSFQGNIVILKGTLFFCTVKKGKLTMFNASLYDITKAIEDKDMTERSLEAIVPE